VLQRPPRKDLRIQAGIKVSRICPTLESGVNARPKTSNPWVRPVKFRCHTCGKSVRVSDAACPHCRIRGAPELVNDGISAVALPIVLGIAIAATIVVALLVLTG